LNELALFAGGGGGLLGSKLLRWRTVCYVENNDYAIEIIKARIRDGMLDDAPIWDDVRTFDGKPWAGSVDIVTAGFPCQPWSVAGKGLGELDDRNLWPDTIRIIREVRPGWVLLENTPGILSKSYIQQIFKDLAESGYDCRWDCIPAAAVGAPHLRYRIWIVAYAQSQRGFELSVEREQENEKLDIIREDKDVSDTYDNSILYDKYDHKTNTDINRVDWWAIEPGMGRVVYGLPNRVDRIRALGNGQVPAVVRAAWELLGGE
jgi:DNA (cytosine-5)-methyltransferase 1